MGKYPSRVLVLILVAALIVCGLGGAFSPLDMTTPTQIAFVIMLVGAILWVSEAVPLFVTSLIILFLSRVWLTGAIEATGATVSSTTYLAPFFSDIILLFLGGFVISSALHKYAIDEDLAHRIIARTGKSIPLMMAGIMGITAFLSMWLSNTATTAMMLALCIPITRRLPDGDPYRKAIILAIPFAANVGGLGTPIGSPPNAIAMQYMRQSGDGPTFVKWMMLGFPAVLVMLTVLWLVITFLYRGQSKSITLDERRRDSVYTPKSILVIAVSLITAAGWITGPLHGYSLGTVALVPVLVFFGGRLLRVADLRALSWDVLLVMGGGLCLGKVVASGGLDTWLIARLPIADASPLVLAALLGGAACLMSTLMSNTATATLIMPIVIGMNLESASPVLVGVAFSCSLAMALPISTPPNALAFSTEGIGVRDILRPGLIGSVIGVAFTFTVFWWWWRLIGLGQ